MTPYILTVTSFKGGTAKTSTTLHIGTCLAKFHKKRVLLIDFDAQANLTLGLGFDPDKQDSMAPVLQGTASLSQVIQKTDIPRLDLVPADTWLERIELTGPLAQDRYSHERLKNIIYNSDYEYIIIDTPPSLSWLTESALIAATHALVCTTAEFYSVKGLERLEQFMRTIAIRHPMEILGVVLSFWNQRGKNNSAFLNVINTTFPNKCFETKIRKDVMIAEASVFGKPLFELPKFAKNSRAADDFQLLTKELMSRIGRT